MYKRRSDITEGPEETTHYTRSVPCSVSEDLTETVRKIQGFKPIEHSLDIYSLTYAVSQLTRTSARKEQNSTNISKTASCQILANEKRSLNSINDYKRNRNKSLHTACALFYKRICDITERPEEISRCTRRVPRSRSEDVTKLRDLKKQLTTHGVCLIL